MYTYILLNGIAIHVKIKLKANIIKTSAQSKVHTILIRLYIQKQSITSTVVTANYCSSYHFKHVVVWS